MRIANLDGRLVLVETVDGAELAVDVETLSDGRFSAVPHQVYQRWDEFRHWADGAARHGGAPIDQSRLGAPSPAPRQVFAIGLNYAEHVQESGSTMPADDPAVFTKFPSCITGPYGEIALPPHGHTDWEVELVAIIGRRAHHVSIEDALDHVAGYAIGQDISERILQMATRPPQFSLGKSLPGFGPIGPWLVTLDEFIDPNDLELGCSLNGEPVQLARTSELIFPVPALIAKLSEAVILLPGDVIFTGTPSGVGLGRTPQRWLRDGDVLTSHVEGIGELRHRFAVRRNA
ncbi:fumarylacetoacetate hydrolase family protein [Amycolatopsis sp. EV170708-02-1]|uniref:fumarylacetoacetate hydrolase family protein n=1 Tax=Amycolatopsis sp. EV170708-02-1 TaxID=2919322 RepID=UPI001F0BF1FE|nr:fumarylacetoacetate hydrolase family protein [Amycolatopsis sp. EV170708-02-1]UMP03427.1 fumarylacetoacetate hydrolase family protein [Amycolatopsis sp. EV170708-02-1]